MGVEKKTRSVAAVLLSAGCKQEAYGTYRAEGKQGVG